MSAAAITYLALIAISMLVQAHAHGTPKTGNYSLWHYMISVAITLGILYWGGFFASVPA